MTDQQKAVWFVDSINKENEPICRGTCECIAAFTREEAIDFVEELYPDIRAIGARKIRDAELD